MQRLGKKAKEIDVLLIVLLENFAQFAFEHCARLKFCPLQNVLLEQPIIKHERDDRNSSNLAGFLLLVQFLLAFELAYQIVVVVLRMSGGEQKVRIVLAFPVPTLEQPRTLRLANVFA